MLPLRLQNDENIATFVDEDTTEIDHTVEGCAKEMCGVSNSSFCRLNELTSAQLGFTKQLVFRIALPHISLLFAATCYVIIGSWALTTFRYIDDRTEESSSTVGRMKKTFIANIIKPRTTAIFQKIDLENSLDNYTSKLHKTYQKHAQHSSMKRPKIKILREADDQKSEVMWDLFFAATALTSIGYGNNAPDSNFARMFVIVYIFFGVPLFLITLADLAKFCTEFINRVYAEVLKYKFMRTRKFRNRTEVPVDEVIIAGGEDEVAEFLWAHLENTHFVEVPFVIVYILLLIYVIIASYLISRIEGWTIYDGFYFVMISVLTIGFGDFVPNNQSYILLTLLTLLLGLILATTCIDVVGAYYIDRLHFFGRNLDTEDPIVWLKEVQQQRIDRMKREAMRKLFETVTALQHMHIDLEQLQNNPSEMEDAYLLSAPNPPRNLKAYNSTADSITLRWDRPLNIDEEKRFWYTVTYKTRTPQARSNPVTVVEFLNREYYVVRELRSFTLYAFSVATTTKFGSSKPITCQEYTEPCTVPQSLSLVAVSSETATFAWHAPRKNNNKSESYVILFSQEPAPQFHFWRRYSCGSAKRFTITDLLPDTRYIMCVTAEHNFGLAAMSKSLRFKTRKSWCNDDCNYNSIKPTTMTYHKNSSASNSTTTSDSIK